MLKTRIATGVNVIDVSPVATPDSLRSGPINQGVGRSRLGSRGQRLSPHHRSLGTLPATRTDDLILTRRRSRLTGTKTAGLLAHFEHFVSFSGNTVVREKPPRGGFVSEPGNTRV